MIAVIPQDEIDINNLNAIYANDTLSHKLLSPQVERALVVEKCQLQQVKRPTANQKARLIEIRQILIRSNMRLVAKVVKSLIKNKGGIDWQDLMQEGAIGLCRGIDKFDASRTNSKGEPLKLSTYVTWWIRQGVDRYILNQRRTIRVPVHMNDRILKIGAITEEFEKGNGRKPTDQELCEITGLTQDKIDSALFQAVSVLSLNVPTDDMEDMELGDVLPDNDCPCPLDRAADNEITETITNIIDNVLKPREAIVIRRRFGLVGGETETLQQIAVKLGITRERVRQIEAEALKKMRHSRVSRRIRDFA